MTTPIPHVIHYCWFGGNPLGEPERQCLASWEKHMPDWEIRRWDEGSFDLECCDYVREAAAQGKWAFVSDYARFKILYEQGGVYLDTDVELLRSLSDIVDDGPYLGCERDASGSDWQPDSETDRGLSVNPGAGVAAAPGDPLCQQVLDSYEGEHFLMPDGQLNTKTIVTRVTAILAHAGLKNVPGIQHVAGFSIYPTEYFSPKNYETGITTTTENTHSIHRFAMSWLEPSQLREVEYLQKYLAAGKDDELHRFLARYRAIFATRDFKRLAEKLKNLK